MRAWKWESNNESNSTAMRAWQQESRDKSGMMRGDKSAATKGVASAAVRMH